MYPMQAGVSQSISVVCIISVSCVERVSKELSWICCMQNLLLSGDRKREKMLRKNKTHATSTKERSRVNCGREKYCVCHY